ncbi:hypothetical protein ADEAN_000346200 [Angomonas deanei]|uniref:Uncharacterized protein n=1 Tax=Angomonas deanei TaxID=59799 RepID=A0A7G2CAS8_9TRYP|nr:hypothetical protein ADEAN_000346200 [Angomonas deanei]
MWELRIAVLPGDPKQGYYSTSRSSSPAAGAGRFSPRAYDGGVGRTPDSEWMQSGMVGEEDQWLGLFLIPQGHRSRLDFRVIAFSELTWVEWVVSGWTESYIGKGWGLYPFLRRGDLMRTDRLARENTVKICIAPTSDLY